MDFENRSIYFYDNTEEKIEVRKQMRPLCFTSYVAV